MFITWLSVWGTANKCRISDLTVIWQVIKFSNTDYPCKKEPGIPRNSGEKFLAFLASLHIRKSQEKARKSQECPGPLAFQEFLEKPGEPRKKISSLSRLFLMCKKARSFWLEWLLAHPGSSLIPGFPGKPGKIKRKFPRFPGFSLCAKKARSFWLE